MCLLVNTFIINVVTDLVLIILVNHGDFVAVKVKYLKNIQGSST